MLRMPISSQTGPTPKPLLRVDEVAVLLGIAPRTVKRLAHDGELRRVVLGRRTTRYHAADVEALIAERTCPSTSEAPAGNQGFAKTDVVSSDGAHRA